MTNARADYGADDQWAGELHAIGIDLAEVKCAATPTASDVDAVTAVVLGDRRGELLVNCKCSHPYHETPCRLGCGCRYYRASVFDASYTRQQDYQRDAIGDYDLEEDR